MFPPQAYFASLNAATNSIVVDSRLSVDLSCSPSASTPTSASASASTGDPSSPVSPSSSGNTSASTNTAASIAFSAPVFTRAGYPDPLASHIITRSDLVGTAPSFHTAHEPPASDTGSSYQTAPEAPPSDSGTKATSEKRTGLHKAFSIRSMAGVKNRFRSRRRSPTEPSSAREQGSRPAPASGGRFSLSATRPSPIAEVSDDSSASPTWSSPAPSSFLGASRLSLLVGGSRGRSGTVTSNNSSLVGEQVTASTEVSGLDNTAGDNGTLTFQVKESRGIKKNKKHRRMSLAGNSRIRVGSTTNSAVPKPARFSGLSSSPAGVGSAENAEFTGAIAGDDSENSAPTSAVADTAAASSHKPLSSFPFSSSSNSSSLEESYSTTPQSLQSRRFSPPTPIYNSQSRAATTAAVSASAVTASTPAPFVSTAPAPAPAPAPTGPATAAAAKAQLLAARNQLKQLPLQRPSLLRSTGSVLSAAPAPAPALTTDFASALAPRRPFSSAAVSASTPTWTRSPSSGRAAAHHFSLPPSASKNQFGIDFESLTFSLDDLNIPTEFESRPPPDLRLSVDFDSSSSASASSCAAAAAAAAAATAASAPKSAPLQKSPIRLLSDSPPPVSSQSVAKSHFSLTETLWPRPRSQSATVEDYPPDLVIDSRGATPKPKAYLLQTSPTSKDKEPRKAVKELDPEVKEPAQDKEENKYSPLAVSIPSDSLLDDAFLGNFSFSKRGSVLLGGHRVISRTIIDEYLRSLVASDPPSEQSSNPTAVPESASVESQGSTISELSVPLEPTYTSSPPGPLSPPPAATLPVSGDSTAFLVTPTVEGVPLIRKTSATPSPSLTSLIAAPRPEDPGYEIISALRRRLTTRSLSTSTLAAVVAASDKAAQAPASPTSQRRLSDDAQTVVSSAGSRTATPSTLAASEDEVDAEKIATTTTTSTKTKMPSPNDLLQPAVPDLEQESHKVRSLYESGETIYWENGRPSSAHTTGVAPGPASVSSDRLEPMPEAPEETENALVTPVTSHLTPNPNPTWTTPRSANSTSSQGRDSSQTRREFELAGGLEDWEDVDSRDVDRYGFINPKSSDTRLPTPTETRQQQMQSRLRRPFSRKDALGTSLHSHNGFGRPPSRKVSARSLNTQASEVSAISWRSTRSMARQAVNMLPTNRDRRWMDDAGDMLTLAPGIADISDDADAGRISEALKRKEWRRIEKWRHMATVRSSSSPGEGQQYEFDMKDPKLIERTWKGIPDCWRAAAWWSFLSQSARENGKSPSEEAIVASFHALQSKPCTDDVQIDLDVPRTISRHIMFRRRYRGGQRLLFRVLHALALYFPDVGYVQGMASLAATLLSYFDEEKAFVMIVRLWTLRGLARLYSPGFEGLMDSLAELEGVWISNKPVAKKMKELCIPPTAYGTRWYLTLFNLSIPFGAQLRIWDVFMLLGSPAVEGRLPPPPSALTALGASAPPRRSAINLLPPRNKSVSAGDGVARPSTSIGTAAAATAAQTPADGLQVLHAAAAALIQALGDVLIDSDFENAMKALTSWIPVKDEDLLMRVAMAEYKTHYLQRKKKRLL
ncbi:hypothetical protein TD95_000794 [Thielaviopsis punctulata]|uniref:Rab-GAP TBC domain-containing protein n=1 Tax=Thielaviopsis punctulata TaxID=72032 RepID=A0A0F4ZKR7_9PEZI|nr:hypothetical protein TD95_000794 [Thielaviopsis punctulata]